MGWTAGDKKKYMEVVSLFAHTNISIPDIAKKVDLHPDRIIRIVEEHQHAVDNMLIVRREMLKDSETQLSKVKPENTSLSLLFDETNIKDSVFLSKLSPVDGEINKIELTFLLHLLYTEDPIAALDACNLNIGLNELHKESYYIARRLRSSYIRMKKNVAKRFIKLKAESLENYGLSKEMVQYEFITQVERLKTSSDIRDKQLLTKNLELLGRTIQGTFDNKITIEKVDPSSAVDALLKLAKQDIIDCKEDCSYTLIEDNENTEEADKYISD